MAEREAFKSLTDAGDAFESSRGTSFRATMSAFAAKDAVVRSAGDRYVVSTFTNLSGSVDTINDRLGTDFVEDPEYHTVPISISWFVETEEEANALAARLVNRSRIVSGVVVGTHSTDSGDVYLDANIDTPFITAPQATGAPAPTRAGGTKKSTAKKATAKSADADVDDADLPF